MAIKIKSLEKISNNFLVRQYIFKDLALDISRTELKAPGINLPTPGTDIKASYDLAAIRNSLQNLFNTLPGQRFLFPEYGLDLYQFLFLPITQPNGTIIGNKIFTTINKFEPRVTVRTVKVYIDPDQNQYTINIVISVPQLNLQTNINSILDTKKQTFIILPTSRNA